MKPAHFTPRVFNKQTQLNMRVPVSLFLAIATFNIFSTSVAAQCREARTVPFNGKNYLFSWDNPSTKDLSVDYNRAQATCESYCMNLVSLESAQENQFVKERISSGNIRYIWTSGKRSPGFKIDQGWYWAGSGASLGDSVRSTRIFGDWSPTGGAGLPQPDNRENNPDLIGFQANEESCLAFLNNFYKDGIKWHDVACYHKKPFVCES